MFAFVYVVVCLLVIFASCVLVCLPSSLLAYSIVHLRVHLLAAAVLVCVELAKFDENRRADGMLNRMRYKSEGD